MIVSMLQVSHDFLNNLVGMLKRICFGMMQRIGFKGFPLKFIKYVHT